MIYRTDYHIHTTYSDGREGPEAYILAAIKAGLKEIGFSEHITFHEGKQKWCMDHSRLPEYTEHILSLGKLYPEIAVRLGVELDYIPNMEKETEKLVTSYPFDFTIGSVHYMGEESVDLGPEFYVGKDINAAYENYFNLVCEAASTGFYDIMGHPDYIRINRVRPGKDITYLYSMIASVFKIHDVAFELNTNGRNKAFGGFYPDKEYLHLFAEQGVAVCVNSDAHFPSRIGQFFNEAYDLLSSAGYKEMAVFKNRERYMIPFKSL